MPNRPTLPAGVTVIERGWLSSNTILLCGQETTALVDSGYCTHSAQTLALIQSALNGRPLDALLNTHLHSDHCGGNAALQNAYPALTTHIPPGLARHVQDWNPHALTYAPTGQHCPPFRFDALLVPGSELRLGDSLWQVHAAPGHDTHSIILFEPITRVLISADALWERGFGVVFPELEGIDAFAEVSQTLDLIETLAPALVIPGHGPVFDCIADAIACARERLAVFTAHPLKHIKYGAKVLLKFKLLEVQCMEQTEFLAWAHATPYLSMIHAKHFSKLDLDVWVDQLLDELIRSGAASNNGQMISNAG